MESSVSTSDSDISDPSISRNDKESLVRLKQLWKSKDIESTKRKEIILYSATQKDPYMVSLHSSVDVVYVDTTEGDITILLETVTTPSLKKKITIKDITVLSGKESTYKTIIKSQHKHGLIESNIGMHNTSWLPSNGSSITFRFTTLNQSKYVWLIDSATYVPPKTYFIPPTNTKQKIKLISGDTYREISKKNYAL